LILLCRTEHSSDQVVKPINLDAITKWVDTFPKEIKKELDTLAPMLKKLGYDIESDTPTYGSADQLVLDNMKELKHNADFWNLKARSFARKAPDDRTLFNNQSIKQ
jgi:protein-tyrosine sulfotransferase